MEDLSEQLARRDNLRRRLAQQRTPQERMAQMQALQQQAWEILRSSPEGLERFLRRNFAKRVTDFREPDAQ